MEMILGMSFTSLNNIDVKFIEKLEKLTLRSYDIIKALSITSRIELINKRKFLKVILNKNLEIFIVYIAILKTTIIHSSWIAQIVNL